MGDIPLQVISENAASERRITPSWSITTLRAKLETITGIPPSSQKLSLGTSAGLEPVPIEASDEDNTWLSSFPLAPYAELHVSWATFRLAMDQARKTEMKVSLLYSLSSLCISFLSC